MRLRYVFVFLLGLFCHLHPVLQAQVRFQRTIDLGGTSDVILSAAPIPTGGYILAGFTNRDAASGNGLDAFMMRLDANGTIVWVHRYGAGNDQIARVVRATADGGFIFAGYNSFTQAPLGAQRQLWVVKTNGAGAVTWQRQFPSGRLSEPGPDGLRQTADGGYVVAGFMSNSLTDITQRDAAVWRFDAGGVLLWARQFPVSQANGGDWDQATTVEELVNGQFVVLGFTQEASIDVFHVRLNPSGSIATPGGIINRYNLGATVTADFWMNMRRLPNGNFLVGGSNNQNVPTGGNDDYLFAVLDSVGTVLNIRGFGTTGRFETQAIAAPGRDGDFYVAGSGLIGINATDLKFTILKVTPTGNVTWSRFYDDPGNVAFDSVTALIPTADSGGIAFGYTRSFNATGDQDLYIVKFDKFGNSGCNQETATNFIQLNLPNPVGGATLPLTANLNNQAPTLIGNAAYPALPASVNPCCANFTVDFDVPGNMCQAREYTFNDLSNAGLNPRYAWDFGNDGTVEQTTQNGTFFMAAAGNIALALTVTNDGGCSTKVVKTITVNPQPLANAGNDTTICEGSIILLNGRASSPLNQNYSWAVQSGAFGSIDPLTVADPRPRVFPLLTTTYNLFYTNPTTGCRDTDQVVVTVRPLPIVDAGVDTVICRGQSIQLQATSNVPGTTYSWTPGINITGANTATPTVFPDSVRKYYVVGTDPNGCQQRDSVTVNVVRVGIGPRNATLCLGQANTTITATPSLPGTYTFTWSPLTDVIGPTNTNQLTVSPTVARRYKVVVRRNNACSDSDSVFVNIAPPPTAEAGNDTNTCQGVNIRLLASGGTIYQWDASPGLAPLNAPNPVWSNPAGTRKFFVTVTDGNGCTDRDSVEVVANNLPLVELGLDEVVCEDACFQLNAGNDGVTFAWTPTDDLSDPTIRNPLVCPTQTRKYFVTVTNAFGCVSRDSITINFDPKPSGVAFPNGATICQGDSVMIRITGTPSTTFEWVDFPGTISDSLRVSAPDSITFRIVPRRRTCVGDTIFARLNVETRPGTTFSATPFVCQGEVVNINYLSPLIPGAVPQWSFGPNAVVVSGSGFGPYQLIYNDTGIKNINLTATLRGCSDIAAPVPVQVLPRPLVDAGPDLFYCQGANGVRLLGSTFLPGSFSATCSYQWSPTTGLSNPFIAQPLASPSNTTVYRLTSICNGCPSRNVDSMQVIVLPRPVSVIDTFQLSFCAGTGGVRLPGRGFGGQGTLSFRWFPSNGIDSVNNPRALANPSVTTRYGLVATDANGCASDTAYILVVVNPVPIANAGPSFNICENTNQGVFLQGSGSSAGFGSLSYLWRPGTSLSDSTIPNPFARPSTTTIYTLFVRNNLTGCSSAPTTLDTLATTVVNVIPTPVADAGPDQAVCPGQGIRIGGAPRNCLPNCAFLWSPSIGLEPGGATLQTPLATPSESRTYYLVVNTGGCQSVADSVRIEVNPAPRVDIVRSALDLCPGDSFRLETVVGGVTAGDFTYQWTPALELSNPRAAQPFVKATTSRTYFFQAFVAGCPASNVDSIRVRVLPAPVINSGRTLVLCGNDADSARMPVSITSTVNPFYIEWSPAAGLSDISIANPQVKVSQSTKYRIRVQTSTCTLFDSVEVFVLPGVTAEIDGPDTVRICEGDSVLLRGLGGVGSAIKTWSPQIGLSDTLGETIWAKPVATRQYVLRVREAGCQSSDTIRIEVSPRTVAAFTASQAGGCDTLSISFTDQSLNAIAWQWNFGDGSPTSNAQNPVHTYFTPGEFRVRLVVTAPGGCNDTLESENLLVVTPQLRPGFIGLPVEPGPLRLPDARVELIDTTEGAVSWLYELGDGTISTSQTLSHQYRQEGEYSIRLTVTDRNGCTGVITKGPWRVIAPDLDIPEVFTPNGDGINDTWNVQYRGSSRWRVYLFDRWGQVVYTSTGSDRGWDGVLRGAEAPAGVYYYTLEVDDRVLKGSVTLLR